MNIGKRKKTAIVRVQTMARAEEVAAFCDERGIEFILGLEPDEPEDITDIERVLNPPQPVLLGPKVGRNDPCPCGSDKKFKKCCEGRQVQTAS